MVLPEMVENLYEIDDDMDDGGSIASSIPDIELEEDQHSLREKQRKRRRRRRQKRFRKEHSKEVSSMPSSNRSESQNNMSNVSLPMFLHPTASDGGREDISPLEDKHNLAAVRFASLVDSRRISKDYYSQLLWQQENSPRYVGGFG